MIIFPAIFIFKATRAVEPATAFSIPLVKSGVWQEEVASEEQLAARLLEVAAEHLQLTPTAQALGWVSQVKDIASPARWIEVLNLRDDRRPAT